MYSLVKRTLRGAHRRPTGGKSTGLVNLAGSGVRLQRNRWLMRLKAPQILTKISGVPRLGAGVQGRNSPATTTEGARPGGRSGTSEKGKRQLFSFPDDDVTGFTPGAAWRDTKVGTALHVEAIMRDCRSRRWLAGRGVRRRVVPGLSSKRDRARTQRSRSLPRRPRLVAATKL